MTISLFENDETDLPPPAEPQPDSDVPRRIDSGAAPVDRWFAGIARSIGMFVLVLTGAIGVFLGFQVSPTLKHYGLDFFTRAEFDPNRDVIGVAAAVVGTIEVAIIALIVGFPLALATALFISEYAPPKIKNFLVSLVDLMAAIPSIVFGLWGLFFLMPHLKYVSRWFSQWFSWTFFFAVNGDPDSASWNQSEYVQSAFIAGVCVSLMVIPLAAAVMRGVFAQAPIGEREAALALGGSKWGMIRTVVLPFGRGGIIGGTMLGLGRALGETVAVLLIIEPKFEINFHVLSSGTTTISSLIAGNFGEASQTQLTALLAAGFVLFVMTLAINTLAAVFVNRSRSGAGTDA